MGFLKNLFKGKDEPIRSYADFWAWFQKNSDDFFKIVKEREFIEERFFTRLFTKLEELKDGYYYLTGMPDDHTVELILTADGDIKNIIFVEELVNAAPVIPRWKFTALKPALGIANLSIELGGYTFDSDSMGFYTNDLPGYPDEIDITIVHNDFTGENKEQISNGTYIFLDNCLGELDMVNNIDNLLVAGREDAQKELIPIEKLNDYLTWRQKEFIEKYEGLRYNTETDNYSILEAELQSGNMLVAVINTELLNWDSKASHPWIATLTLKYDGSKNNGLPNEEDYQLLNRIEENIMKELKDYDGYLNIGRQTAEGERSIYFACREFRQPSKVFFKIQQDHSKSFDIEYDIFKDKYWRSFERFNNS